MTNNATYQKIIDTIPNPVIITDGQLMAKCNKAFLKFFGIKSREEFLESHDCVCDLFIPHKDYFSLDLIDKDTLWTDYLFENEDKSSLVSLLDREGDVHALEITLDRLEENSHIYIVVFTDITAIQNEKKLYEILAYKDPLTKIYNRQKFNDLMIKEKENIIRYKDRVSLIMFDIDYFKKINDTYGHEIGDRVLVRLVNIVQKNLRVNDIFARWGGEEFMILLPRTDIETAYKKAQQLRKIIEEHEEKAIPKFTVSFGVVEISEQDEDRMCFQRVDKALYEAKIKRNDVVKIMN
jgi:diguanylate cyclase (GGDEF)-like protein